MSKCESEENRRQAAELALHILLVIPCQSAELLKTCQVLIIGSSNPHAAPLSLSLSLCLSVYLAGAQSKCAKQKKQSVTEHFSILLMLQLFPRILSQY